MACESSPPKVSLEPVRGEPILAELAEPRHGSTAGRWLIRVVVWLMVGAVAVSLVLWLIPRELQRWRLAAAEELRLDGDLSGAVERLNREIDKDPRDAELLLRRTQWLLDDGQFGAALADVKRVLDLHPDALPAWQLRASIHQSLGDFAAAVEDWKQIVLRVPSGPGRATVLNGLAYALSLANVEIEEGLALVEEAIRLQGENYALLDTRGFLHYRRGDRDRALADLDNAVGFAEAEWARLATASPEIADRRLKRAFDRQQSQAVAVIRYHRSLIHDSRRDTAKAEEDRRRVRELGFEPGEGLF